MGNQARSAKVELAPPMLSAMLMGDALARTMPGVGCISLNVLSSNVVETGGPDWVMYAVGPTGQTGQEHAPANPTSEELMVGEIVWLHRPSGSHLVARAENGTWRMFAAPNCAVPAIGTRVIKIFLLMTEAHTARHERGFNAGEMRNFLLPYIMAPRSHGAGESLAAAMQAGDDVPAEPVQIDNQALGEFGVAIMRESAIMLVTRLDLLEESFD